MNELEKENIKYKEQLQFLAEISGVAFWEFDFKTNIFKLNDFYYKFLKTTAEYENGYEMSVENYLEAFIPTSSQVIVANVIEYAYTQTNDYTSKFEYEMRRRDNEILKVLVDIRISYDKDGKPDKAYGTKKDLTYEKNKQLNLEVSLEEQRQETLKSDILFKTIFDQTLDGITIMDLESNFLLANNAYLKMTDFSIEELKKKSCIKLTVPEMREKAIISIKTTIKKGIYGSFQKSCYVKNRRKIDIVMDMVLMPDKKSILAITKDVTLKNKYAKEREEQEKYLLQQSRLAQMGEMIGNIAHQWRQPLNALGLIIQKIGFYQSNGMLDDKKIETSIIKSMDLIANMSTTIDDFSDFFKPNKSKENFLLHEVIHKSYSILEHSFRQIAIVCSFDVDDDIAISGFKNEFSQVILNILNNAKDAILDKKIEFPVIKINTSKIEDGISINIIDNAGGIDENIIEQIFYPYFTTKHKDTGTGIGLYMSKMIIEDHMNGRLSVENLENGACFSIHLTDIKT